MEFNDLTYGNPTHDQLGFIQGTCLVDDLFDTFKDAVVQSAITRAQPIALTGLAAMMGAFFILDDPIFNGLAISLIFGIFVSTLLTLVVIPLLYFVAYRGKYEAAA